MSKTKAKGGKMCQKTPRPGRRLGVKRYGGERVGVGEIIVRQSASKFHPGSGVKMGRDFTIFAMRQGVVKFEKRRDRRFVSVK